jgi:hypothetical protein
MICNTPNSAALRADCTDYYTTVRGIWQLLLRFRFTLPLCAAALRCRVRSNDALLSFERGIRHFFTKNVVFVKKSKERCRVRSNDALLSFSRRRRR